MSAMTQPSPDCALCPRLVTFRADNRRHLPDSLNAPVASFGAVDSALLVVGLAPGLRGANRTGRPFTGDAAGDLLYTLSRGGRMGIVRPTPTGHKVISSFKIPAGGKGPSWAHPVVCGGRLYIRHAGFLYVYDVQEHD